MFKLICTLLLVPYVMWLFFQISWMLTTGEAQPMFISRMIFGGLFGFVLGMLCMGALRREVFAESPKCGDRITEEQRITHENSSHADRQVARNPDRP